MSTTPSSTFKRAFTKFRYGHAVHPHLIGKKRDATSCKNGGFYKSPTASQTIDSTQPLNISWDNTCLQTDAIDIYLYDSAATNPLIHLWANVNFGLGSYQADLNAQWWNATSSANLQLAIVPKSTPLFMAPFPAGPVFTATYSGGASGALSNDDSTATTSGAVEQVNNFDSKHGLSGGKIAAAVIMPLLVVIALAVGFYIKINRQKGREDRKRWTEAVDKRMSTISKDWNSISAAGAQAAIRNSMAVSPDGNRASSFSFGAIRPSSTLAVEGGQAGIGTQAVLASGGIDLTTPQMTQLRAGPRPAVDMSQRVSRISFAADTRPSRESRRTIYSERASRAFHVGHVPPVPERQDSGEMSPTQTAGPLSLTVEDIHARMSGSSGSPRPSVDEVYPALSMMRTGGENSTGNDEMLLSPQLQPLTPPAPIHQVPKSSIVGIMPMQPMPANFMSPDDMLRAYAESRNTMGSAMGGPAVPAPVASYNGNGMRVLYQPTSPDTVADPDNGRKSLAPTIGSKYDDEDVYSGTAA